MKKRLIFLMIATPIIWLVVVAPLTTLFSWWTPSLDTFKALAWSVLLAPVVSFSIFASFQTSNLLLKWPLTQLIGWTTVLMNVVAVCWVLLFFLPGVTVALISTIAWLLIGAYAVRKAHDIKNTGLEIRSDKINKPCKLMHLSDVHAGSRRSAFIEKVVDQAIQKQPDIVVITGDLLDSSAVDSKYLQPLSKFSCPVYLCLGNHERYVDLQNAIDAIKANNVRVLRDESVVTADLEIIGIDDAENPAQVESVLPTIKRNTSLFQILLYHKPQGFEFAAANHTDLMLSGHTHAGQVWPFRVLVKRQFPLIKGVYQQNGSTLYVSQGTGTWGPIMRLGTECEMTLITLTPGSLAVQ